MCDVVGLSSPANCSVILDTQVKGFVAAGVRDVVAVCEGRERFLEPWNLTEGESIAAQVRQSAC